jgi:hypothetical protein
MISREINGEWCGTKGSCPDSSYSPCIFPGGGGALGNHKVPPSGASRLRLETGTTGIRGRSDNYSSSTFRLELSDCSVNTDDDMGVPIWWAYLLQSSRDLYVSAYHVAGADLVSRLCIRFSLDRLSAE